MTGAKVHIRPHDGATQFHVHGTGIIIGRLLNELGIARRVATAISQGLG
jgi:H+/gluconate symporter-like permease